MSRTTDLHDCYSNISRIISFFRRTSGSGFLFCVCDNDSLVKEINGQIVARSEEAGLNIRELYVASEQADHFLSLIREAAHESPDGLILNNLNELILLSEGSFVRKINFAREILIELNVPILFWLSERNVSLFANTAPDLFSRRDRGVIHFGNVCGITALDRFKDDFAPAYRDSGSFKDLSLKMELLEKQLQDAEEKHYDEKRIATEIVADLIRMYLKSYLRSEAWELFEKYGMYFQENANRIKYSDLLAELYESMDQWDRALEYYFQSEKILMEVGDRAGLATTYNNIGLIYSKKGEWDKALEYYLKSEKIRMEVGDRAGLAATYNNIGSIYDDKGEWDKALEYYLKSEKISLEVGDRAGLAPTYNNIGLIYSNKGEWDKALEYCLKSEKIRMEVDDRAGLAFTWFNIGNLLKKQKEGHDYIPYLAGAGYLATTLGMGHKLSDWAWALDPIRQELGEEKFLEMGKRFYEEKQIHPQ